MKNLWIDIDWARETYDSVHRVYFHPAKIHEALTAEPRETKGLLGDIIRRQYRYWWQRHRGMSDDCEATENELIRACQAVYGEERHIEDPMLTWLHYCICGQAETTLQPTTTTTPQPETNIVATPSATRDNRGRKKSRLFDDTHEYTAKKKDFLHRYEQRFSNRAKQVTTSVADDDFNQFIIELALLWGEEHTKLQKGMGAAWRSFLMDLDFEFKIAPHTWYSQIHTHIDKAWRKRIKNKTKA